MLLFYYYYLGKNVFISQDDMTDVSSAGEKVAFGVFRF